MNPTHLRVAAKTYEISGPSEGVIVIISFTPEKDQPLLFFHILFFLLYSALHHVVLPEASQDQSQHCTAVMVTVNTKSRFLADLSARKGTETRTQRASETRKQDQRF